MTKEEIKVIRETLIKKVVNFTVEGLTEWDRKEDGTYGYVLKEFKTGCHENGETSSISDLYYRGMNVNKFGPTCVTLYAYDLIGNKTIGKIKYEDVKLLKIEENV